MPSDFGRARGSRIELNRLLTREAAEEGLRRTSSRTSSSRAAAPASRRARRCCRRPSRSSSRATPRAGRSRARAFSTRPRRATGSLAHADETPGARGDSRAAQQALARVLALPEKSRSFDAYFAGVLAPAGARASPASGALAVLSRRGARPPRPSAAPSRADFLLVDGLSGETLAEDGHPRARFPAGSILKPSLVAAVPALMERRAARDASSGAARRRRSRARSSRGSGR